MIAGLQIKRGKTKKQTTAKVKKIIKIAETQSLRKVGYSYRQIGKLLHIDAETAAKYDRLESEEIRQLTEVMNKRFIAQDWQLSTQTFQKINEHLEDKEKMSRTKLFELTGLYKVSRELLQPKSNGGSTTNIQIINTPDKFSLSSTDPNN